MARGSSQEKLPNHHPLIGAHQFLAEMRRQLANYAKRADQLSDPEWDINQLPHDVRYQFGVLAGHLQETVSAIAECGRVVEEHIPHGNFRD